MQFWQLFCASLLIFSVASCKKETSTTTAPTAPTTPISTAPTTPIAPTPTAPTDPTSQVDIEVPAPKSGTISAGEKSTSLMDFQTKIGSTEKAIVAGKLAEAKTEFTAVETAWKVMESGVLSKSPDRYKTIIASEIKSVISGIDRKQDKDTLLASLKRINQNIDLLRK